MSLRAVIRKIALITLLASGAAGCQSTQTGQTSTALPAVANAPATPTIGVILPTFKPVRPTPGFDISAYTIPGSIDPARKYLFYLHGKIIEDQGIPAISPDYGEYEYQAILETLSGYGFVVISEIRPEDTDSAAYARKIISKINVLLNAGVPAQNITVVGASKGGGIAILVSNMLKNNEINFVIMAICEPSIVKDLKNNQIYLVGNVLSIYDSSDEYAGSCQDLFRYSKGKGISRYAEVVLNIGTGHGILYKPLDEWIMPVVEWTRGP